MKRLPWSTGSAQAVAFAVVERCGYVELVSPGDRGTDPLRLIVVSW